MLTGNMCFTDKEAAEEYVKRIKTALGSLIEEEKAEIKITQYNEITSVVVSVGERDEDYDNNIFFTVSMSDELNNTSYIFNRRINHYIYDLKVKK